MILSAPHILPIAKLSGFISGHWPSRSIGIIVIYIVMRAPLPNRIPPVLLWGFKYKSIVILKSVYLALTLAVLFLIAYRFKTKQLQLLGFFCPIPQLKNQQNARNLTFLFFNNCAYSEEILFYICYTFVIRHRQPS